ncbi:MAG: 3-dehydroquinate synthase [Bacteroidetes bacterium]|nr:MAG: 3-dehydroquinate synthase [Bacteroidota bacterium]
MDPQNIPSAGEVVLPEGRSYTVHFSRFQTVPERMMSLGLQIQNCLLVTDENVGALYQADLEKAFESAGGSFHSIILPPGESTKSPRQLERIYEFALSTGITRSTPVVALGGGVIGDIAGFAAATLLRGLPLVHVPTTLVAQVDSSIGGKTGLNHSTGKNLIGSFYQPRMVCADFDTLRTLSDREWTSGMAEVIKHALILDINFFRWIEEHIDGIVARDYKLVPAFVACAAAIKCEVVSADEFESDHRMILNFGHTFGHALERSLGFKSITHGEAVAIGMKAALHLSVLLGNKIELDRIFSVLSSIPVPSIPDSISIDNLCLSMTTDKKRTALRLRFVVLSGIGKAYVTADVPTESVSEAWRRALAR